jgi:Protein of unknown function (DUF3800)
LPNKYVAFLDESGTHKGSSILALGGYIFTERSSRMFSNAWKAKLSSLNLKFAHMTDCALGFGEYRKWSKEKRVLSEKHLISAIHKHSLEGFCITVDVQDYSRIMGNPPILYSAYTYLLLQCVEQISKRIRSIDSSAFISYVFESGHASQGQADKYMKALPFTGLPASQNYLKHNFSDKKTLLPLQAADMLVWQYRHHLLETKRRPDFKIRRDFEALQRIQDLCTEVESVHLVHMAQMYKAATQNKQIDPDAGAKYLIDNPYFQALLKQ